MPKPYLREFRADVVAVARRGEAPLKQIAADFGISESCLANWLRAADVEDALHRRPESGWSLRRCGINGFV